MGRLAALTVLPLLAGAADTHFCLYYDGNQSYPNDCYTECPSTCGDAALFADEAFFDNEICQWFRDSVPYCQAGDCVEAEHFQLACDLQSDFGTCYQEGMAALGTIFGDDFMMAEVSTSTFANRSASRQLLEANRDGWPQAKFVLDHVLTPIAGGSGTMPAIHSFGTWANRSASGNSDPLPCYMRWESQSEEGESNAKSWLLETFVPVSPTSLSPGPSHGDANLTQRLQARMVDFATRYNAKDYSTLLQLYAPQLVIAPKTGRPLNSNGALDFFMQQPLGSSNITVTVAAALMSTLGRAAHSFGSVTSASGTMPFYARWVPEKDSYLIEAQVFTGMAGEEYTEPTIII
eukprot:NODE_10839_length_1325_cov_4.248748.p1 GENE.NODE_10839_length_1325_cov_4.248748~~NODE_10839_length_1325_cov_4.248748.p1  ORF type:complete len:348 (-),score=95.30 NODE_10839_length_1325_cov_4.248748:198-1241(-)